VNKLYNIINIRSGAAFEIDSQERFIGQSLLPDRNGQKWILENADNGLFYIKRYDVGTYLRRTDNGQLGFSSDKQAWRIQPHGSSNNTFKILQPDNRSTLEMRKVTRNDCPDLEVSLWKPRDRHGDSQVWEFKRFYPTRTFRLDCAYLIINVASGTSADLEYDDDDEDEPPSLVGNERSDQNPRQKWIFRDARNNQVLIQNSSSRMYVSIDGTDPGSGTEILCTRNKQAWDVIPDLNDPSKFRICYPNTEFTINLENGDTSNGAQIQIDQFDQGSDSQKWKFETPGRI